MSWRSLARGASLLAIVALALALVAGCSSKPTAQDLEGKLREAITNQLEPKGVAVKGVSCPQDDDLQKGDRLSCDVPVTENRQDIIYTASVSITEADGDSVNYRYLLDGLRASPATVQAELEQRLTTGPGAPPSRAVVTCPDRAYLQRDGQVARQTFDCQAILTEAGRGSETRALAVTFAGVGQAPNLSAQISYELKPVGGQDAPQSTTP